MNKSLLTMMMLFLIVVGSVSCGEVQRTPTTTPDKIATGVAEVKAIAATLTAEVSITENKTSSTDTPISQTITESAFAPLPKMREVITTENCGKVTELMQWNADGEAERLAISSDMKWMAISSKSGTHLYDFRRISQVRFLPVEFDPNVHEGSEIAFSPNGKLLADWSGNVWNIPEGTKQYTLQPTSVGKSFGLPSVGFSPDGTVLATYVETGINLWRVTDGTLLKQLDQCAGQGVYFSPDGSHIVSVFGAPLSGLSSFIALCRVSDGALIYKASDNTYYWYSSSALSPDGTVLAAGLTNGTVELRHAADGGLIQMFNTRNEGDDSSWVIGLAFSPNGEILATYSSDLKLWRVSDFTLLHSVNSDLFILWTFAFTPDGKAIVAHPVRDSIFWWGIP